MREVRSWRELSAAVSIGGRAAAAAAEAPPGTPALALSLSAHPFALPPTHRAATTTWRKALKEYHRRANLPCVALRYSRKRSSSCSS